MGRNGLPYFPMDVDDYLEDEAVVLMSAEAEGCYIRLLCRSWKSKTPGVIKAALVGELCGLHRVAESERERVLSEVGRAFVITDTDWTQRRMQVEFRRADCLYEARKRGARKTNGGNIVTRSPRAERSLSARSPGVGVGVGVEKRSERSLTLPTPPPGQAAPSPTPHNPATSTPVALRPVNRTNQPPTIDPAELEPVTCHRCRNRFTRPKGSQRTLCPPCHEDDSP